MTRVCRKFFIGGIHSTYTRFSRCVPDFIYYENSMVGSSFKRLRRYGVPDARLRCKRKLGVLQVEHEPRIHLLQRADDGSASRRYGKARDPPLLVIHHQEQLLRRDYQHRFLVPGEVKRQRLEAPLHRLRRPDAEAVPAPPHPLRSVALEVRPHGLLDDVVRRPSHHRHRRAEVDHAPSLPVLAAGEHLRPDPVEPAGAQADADEANDLGGPVPRVARDVGAETEESLAVRLAAVEEAVGEPREPAGHGRRADDAGEHAVVLEMVGLVSATEGDVLVHRVVVGQLVGAQVALDGHVPRAVEAESACFPVELGPVGRPAERVGAGDEVVSRRGGRVEETVALRGVRVAPHALHPYQVARGVDDLEEVVLVPGAGADADDQGFWQA
uniref:Uncharacterized protein n=1 Tax=Setaria italica TaxID=4555 RepID=K3XXJ1_SETIT